MTIYMRFRILFIDMDKARVISWGTDRQDFEILT